jgi:HEAT repeat protein
MQWWTLKQLKSASAKARLAAVEKLGAEGDTALIEPLTHLLSDPDATVRAASARALGRIQSEEAADPLFTCLRAEPDAEVRRAVIKAIPETGSPRGIPLLVEALGDPCGEVGWQAAQALKALRWEPFDDAQRAALHLASNQFDAAIALGSAAIAPLIKAAQGSSFHRSIKAVEALAIVGGAQAVKPILDCLQSSDYTVRSAAATALGEIGDARALEPLIAALRDANHQVCLAACISLGKISDERAVEPVIGALQHRAPDVRTAAVETLGKLRSALAVPSLFEGLRDEDTDVRAGAAASLGLIGDEAAIEPLVGALTDPQTIVRQAAAAALCRIQPHWESTEGAARAIPVLQLALRSSEYWVRHSAGEILKKLGLASQKESPLITDSDGARKKRSVAQEILFGMLDDRDRAFRQAAAETLGRMGLAESISRLVERLCDTDRGVKRAAARALELLRWQADQLSNKARQLVALERWSDAAALRDDAVDALTEAAVWRDPLACRCATKALAQIGTEKAFSHLRALATEFPDSIDDDVMASLAPGAALAAAPDRNFSPAAI